MAEASSVGKAEGGLTRRGFLTRAALGAAAVAGLGVVLGRRFARESRGPAPLELDEDSIFTPRADQRERVLGRK